MISNGFARRSNTQISDRKSIEGLLEHVLAPHEWSCPRDIHHRRAGHQQRSLDNLDAVIPCLCLRIRQGHQLLEIFLVVARGLGRAAEARCDYCIAANNSLSGCQSSLQNYQNSTRRAIRMDVQMALFVLLLWCTPSLLLLICLVLRTPTGFD
jgi:hypothetical protein